MTIPFDHIGPTQIGRLVYQVIGKDGPIFNPTNITYLSADEAPDSPVFNQHSALAGCAGINLAASIAGIAVSTAVLQQVRQMQRQLAEINERLGEIASVMSDVQRRVQRIDTRLAESHLREALRHVLQRGITSESIDLAQFTSLIDDLQNIEDTIEGGLFCNF